MFQRYIYKLTRHIINVERTGTLEQVDDEVKGRKEISLRSLNEYEW